MVHLSSEGNPSDNFNLIGKGEVCILSSPNVILSVKLTLDECFNKVIVTGGLSCAYCVGLCN